MNDNMTTKIDVIKTQLESSKLKAVHHCQNHWKLIETHKRTTAALMELEECLTESSAQLEKYPSWLHVNYLILIFTDKLQKQRS